jgi:hypothetical protein
MAYRFRLALKVQSSNVRTDTDRAAGLMKDTKNVREAKQVLSFRFINHCRGSKQSPLSHSNKYSADSACGHYEGVVRHEPWCVTQNASVQYAYRVISDPSHLSRRLACFRHCMDREENPIQAAVVTRLRDNIKGYSRDPAIFRGIKLRHAACGTANVLSLLKAFRHEVPSLTQENAMRSELVIGAMTYISNRYLNYQACRAGNPQI